MEIRAEHASDVDSIRAVQVAAFHRPGDGGAIPMEAPLVDALRADLEAWIPALSLVAVDGAGDVVGHVVCSRSWVGEERHHALGLGPIGVRPDVQGQGIGSALMRKAVAVATARHEPLIGLLGNPAYYGRFGFVISTAHGIDAPDPAWGELFQVLPLEDHDPSITGTFRYASAFG